MNPHIKFLALARNNLISLNYLIIRYSIFCGFSGEKLIFCFVGKRIVFDSVTRHVFLGENKLHALFIYLFLLWFMFVLQIVYVPMIHF